MLSTPVISYLRGVFTLSLDVQGHWFPVAHSGNLAINTSSLSGPPLFPSPLVILTLCFLGSSTNKLIGPKSYLRVSFQRMENWHVCTQIFKLLLLPFVICSRAFLVATGNASVNVRCCNILNMVYYCGIHAEVYLHKILNQYCFSCSFYHQGKGLPDCTNKVRLLL